MIQEATCLIHPLPYGTVLMRRWGWVNVPFLSKGFAGQKLLPCGWTIMFVERYSRIWGSIDRLWLNCEGPSIPTYRLWTMLGGNGEPLRVGKQGGHFIRVVPLNINLMPCAGQMEKEELGDGCEIPGRGGKGRISHGRHKQHPGADPNRILLCVESSLNTPPECEARALSGIYLTYSPFPLHTQWQAHIGTENNHRLNLVEMEGNVPKMGKEGDRADYSLSCQRRPIYKPYQECQSSHARPLSFLMSWFLT